MASEVMEQAVQWRVWVHVCGGRGKGRKGDVAVLVAGFEKEDFVVERVARAEVLEGKGRKRVGGPRRVAASFQYRGSSLIVDVDVDVDDDRVEVGNIDGWIVFGCRFGFETWCCV